MLLTINIDELRYEELPQDEKALTDAARKATDNSYSPYSHFRVGAAVRLADGSIVSGANQENAAYSVTICAERAALFAAQSQAPEQAVTAIAIAARDDEGRFTAEPVPPCGSCRQAIFEMEKRYGRDVRVLMCGASKVYAMESVKCLLPFGF